MMANVVEHLRNELEALQASIARQQRQAEGLSLTISYLEEKDNGKATGTAAPKASSPRRRKESSAPPSPLIQAVIDTLRANGKPMHYKSILQIIESEGHKVGGKDPRRTLSAHLCFNRRFFKAQGEGVWALAEWNKTESGVI